MKNLRIVFIQALDDNIQQKKEQEEKRIAKTSAKVSILDSHIAMMMDDTIPKMESDELIKSSDENLVPIPSESEDFSDIENFIPSHNDLGSDLDVSSPSGDRNKIYDPGICIEVESTRFLATLSPVIDTLLPFSSENKDKVFNHGVLASKEKSPPSSSHRGFKASKLFHHKSPMLIHGENIPILDVLIAPDYESSRAHGFVLCLLEL
ncbi:hypothetical protein Tco_1243493 [Tanacetum coccineum]